MKSILFLLFSFITLTGFSQTKVQWAEKDSFHRVMAQTFHPMEEGNYKPIRERISEMVTKAVAWQNSAMPEGLNTKKVKKTLKKLVEESKELEEKIKKNCSDADIKEDLTELHDIFHSIVGLCKHE